MIRFSFLVLLSFSIISNVHAQRSYTLQQCIDTALANNIPVKQAELRAEEAQVNWKQARMNLLPDLNASISHGVNSGRSIDPFTNTYVTQSVNRANYGISSGVVVFNGMTLQNRIKETSLSYEAARMEGRQSRDELTINVIQAYLSVLTSEDQLRQAEKQVESSRKALERLEVLNSQGAIRPSDLSDLKGQLMNDQLLLLNGKNQMETFKLQLAQLMNKPYDPLMKLERISADEFLSTYPLTAPEVFEQALNQFAGVKAVEMRTKSARYNLKANRGQLYPMLSFGGDINTNYSSIAQSGGQKIPYSSQLRNNRYTAVGLGLRIPIFNQSFVRNRIKIADINLRNSELVEENTRLRLHQLIDQAYLNMTNSYERYKLLLEQVNAYQESFRAAEIRFQSGVGTSIDYLAAKDRLDRASISLVNAQYDYVLRKRILDYYKGK
jgi:outer membrane protein